MCLQSVHVRCAIYTYQLEYQLPIQQKLYGEHEQEQKNVWKQLSPKNPLPLLTAGCQCFLETAQATRLYIIKKEGISIPHEDSTWMCSLKREVGDACAWICHKIVHVLKSGTFPHSTVLVLGSHSMPQKHFWPDTSFSLILHLARTSARHFMLNAMCPSVSFLKPSARSIKYSTAHIYWRISAVM